MSFKEFYESIQQVYKYRIKSINRIDDEEMDIIERVIDKYRPSKISKVDKLMFQTNPLGFTGVQNAEVYYIDVELTIPVTSPTLAYDLKIAFGLNPNSPIIQVQGENDDAGADNEEMIEKTASKEGALLCDPTNSEVETPDAEESFGDAYNRSFLAYVKKVEAESELNQEIDAPHPITKWGDQPKRGEDIDDSDFNKDLEKKQKPFIPRAKLPNPKEEK